MEFSQEETDRLKDAISLGSRAEKAYNTYVRQFLETQYSRLYQEFLNSTSDAEVIAIKRLIDAVQQLEVSLRNDVESGKIASRRLEE